MEASGDNMREGEQLCRLPQSHDGGLGGETLIANRNFPGCFSCPAPARLPFSRLVQRWYHEPLVSLSVLHSRQSPLFHVAQTRVGRDNGATIGGGQEQLIHNGQRGGSGPERCVQEPASVSVDGGRHVPRTACKDHFVVTTFFFTERFSFSGPLDGFGCEAWGFFFFFLYYPLILSPWPAIRLPPTSWSRLRTIKVAAVEDTGKISVVQH